MKQAGLIRFSLHNRLGLTVTVTRGEISARGRLQVDDDYVWSVRDVRFGDDDVQEIRQKEIVLYAQIEPGEPKF